MAEGPIVEVDAMDFKEYVALHKNEVYSKICEYVPIKEPAEHYGIMRDYIDRQGSYRRPGLLLLSAQMFGAKAEDALLPAAAMQLSEDWILMQDDAEDDSEMRRGKPAAQKLYGWVHAIDASDSGHMAMWRMLKDYMLKAGTERGNRLYEKFYDMIAYTVEGQFIENKFIQDTKDLDRASEELYYRIVDSKTCYYTVYGPLQLGAMAAGAGEKELEALKAVGKDAGTAFQITDDILDVIGDEKKTGKRPLGDLYEGKVTLIVLYAYKCATPDERQRMNAIYRKKRAEKTPEEIMFLYDMIKKYGGVDYAKGQAKAFGERAKRAAEAYGSAFPDNEYKGILMSAIEEMYVREK